MQPLYIFDLGGTLADTEHRIHFIQRPDCPFCGWSKGCDHDLPLEQQLHGIPRGERPKFTPDWRAFFAACVEDGPINTAITTFDALRSSGAECWIWTGRSDEVREQTLEWLRRNLNFTPGRFGIGAPEKFLMRKAGDHRLDHVIKAEWLSLLDPPERNRLTAVFEDRSRVVQMWREAGIPCFQVAPGDF
jgi:hypothetical protein